MASHRMALLAVLGALVVGLMVFGNFKQITDQSVMRRFKMNPDRKDSALTPKAGWLDTDNNLAYFNTPIPRHRQNGLTLYEAEAVQNKFEVQDELLQARKEGNPIRQLEVLARWHRAKDQAIKNVAADYDNQFEMINIRRNEQIGSTKRVMETIADNPKLWGISAWVPHYRSTPIPESFGRAYWRPTQYMTPGYTHV